MPWNLHGKILRDSLSKLEKKGYDKFKIGISMLPIILFSEFPIGTIPEKRNFPARNRIISGISKGVIVIEAKKKSGTLLTVDFALDQGKDIYAVPGNINSINSVGTNDLIKQGAKLVTNFEEIDI